jgi:hypothetical protein
MFFWDMEIEVKNFAKYIYAYSYKMQVEIVVGSIALHNYIKR